jgi:hypothetical protein
VNAVVDPPVEATYAEGTLVGDHFQLVRRLGAGGMGEVYLATNLNLPGKRYAVKVLRQELSDVQRFAELLNAEARRQARLDHDNIVQIYDYFHWQGHHCLVLAFVDGGTLADRIEAEPNGLKEAQALDVMLAILRGLNHAHEHGVLHCDIKPANVLIDTEQRVRVTDFGIARDLDPNAAGQRRGIIGTPAYMSPEQIADPEAIDHRSDVYSAGIVLFEMLTGRLPFKYDDEPGGLEYPQLTMEPASIRDYRPELPPRLASIVATTLQRNPSGRYQGCIEFQRAIERYRRGQRWRRTWLPALSVMSVLAVAGAIGGWQWKFAVEEEARQKQREAEQSAILERMASQARARKSIEASIDSGIRQLGSLCREAKNLQARRKFLATSTAEGFFDLAEKFRKQVGESEQNMADYAGAYAATLGQLARFDAVQVRELLTAHPAQDNESARLLTALRADHGNAAVQRPKPDQATLLARCDQGPAR